MTTKKKSTKKKPRSKSVAEIKKQVKDIIDCLPVPPPIEIREEGSTERKPASFEVYHNPGCLHCKYYKQKSSEVYLIDCYHPNNLEMEFNHERGLIPYQLVFSDIKNAKGKCKDFSPTLWFKIKRFF